MSLNKVILIGSLGQDAEQKLINDKTVALFSIATSERYTDRNGQKQEITEWHNCEYWKGANIIPYLKKGQLVYVEGSIKTDRWTDQNNQKRETKKIAVTNVQLLGSKGSQSSSNDYQQSTVDDMP